jgi:hypothetical protein
MDRRGRELRTYEARQSRTNRSSRGESLVRGGDVLGRRTAGRNELGLHDRGAARHQRSARGRHGRRGPIRRHARADARDGRRARPDACWKRPTYPWTRSRNASGSASPRHSGCTSAHRWACRRRPTGAPSAPATTAPSREPPATRAQPTDATGAAPVPDTLTQTRSYRERGAHERHTARPEPQAHDRGTGNMHPPLRQHPRDVTRAQPNRDPSFVIRGDGAVLQDLEVALDALSSRGMAGVTAATAQAMAEDPQREGALQCLRRGVSPSRRP